MRIIGGVHKGRRLKGPKGSKTRPTSDATREAIFNILAHEGDSLLQGATVLDLFAGSGAMGLEALSRGAARVTFVESDPMAIRVLGDNIALLGAADRTAVVKVDALKLARTEQAADLVFVDPPYRRGLAGPALNRAADKGWVGPDTLIILETAKSDQVALPKEFAAYFERIYGGTRVALAKLVPTD